jgi:hypothetical protein
VINKLEEHRPLFSVGDYDLLRTESGDFRKIVAYCSNEIGWYFLVLLACQNTNASLNTGTISC